MSDTSPSSPSLENDIVDLTAGIVSAYVSNNTIASGELAALIATVHSALSSTAQTAQEPIVEELVPAVPLKKSVTDNFIVCLEDGKKFKSLKRHLRTHFDMTPEDYRAKWNLPADYPMIAPNYAAARSELARKMGLGQKQGRRSKSASKS
ncbi:MucR family transcriptional regulator [Roseibium sediminicola]|uniref:MucR family transcriptional regulator n=1 Tax=Roseibium sediminicola TaxID=2933272 RepID=A0ABT0H1L8_9HYPH|nr:MucR family transcriptional regulator [Roseibium sp. CAU 1639]MCK7614968.1 MucR family transcriptional regulator [Roseibium sp. CAU 1639]